MPVPSLTIALARSFADGPPEIEQIVEAGSRTLGRRWRWLRPLAQRYIAAFAGRTRPRHRDVVHFLLQDAGFRRARSRHLHELTVEQWLTETQEMQPVAAASTWDLPAIESAGALAEWLLLDHADLAWFADLKGLAYKRNQPRLRHYHYQVRINRSGSLRLIEAPKVRLKKIQRQILAGILARIPPHPAAQGFLKGHSIKTFVAPHVGQRVVLRMDLQDFFPSIAGARIQALFRTMGYPETVADLLGGICTNATPRDAWKEAGLDIPPLLLREARALYSRPHLPQGAPTSPALANLCAYRVDCRLAGLAGSVGARYTRYADDLGFSGGEAFERRVERFATHAAAILREEGFSVHHRKTRTMRQGVGQHLAGLVANRRMNVMRSDFDRLKAILTNCVRLGPESQNRSSVPDFRAHLVARVGFVETINRAKGQRLRRIFDRIRWQ
jgi:RNA-directed DNA polymerase